MDKADITAQQIKIWFEANRKGENESLPCFWVMYPMKTSSQLPKQNQAKYIENYSVTGIEESVQHLMECMSSAPSIRYFAIRLKSKSSGDIGYTVNYANPYYQIAGIAGFGSQNNSMQSNDLVMAFVGLMREGNEQRLEAKEASTQRMIADMEARRKADLSQLKKELKHEKELQRLKDENEALKNSNTNFVGEILTGVKPELMEIAKLIISSKSGLKLAENSESIEGAEQASDSENTTESDKYLEYAVKNIKRIDRLSEKPEQFLYKVGIVLNSINEEQRDQIINTIEATFSQKEKNKANGG